MSSFPSIFRMRIGVSAAAACGVAVALVVPSYGGGTGSPGPARTVTDDGAEIAHTLPAPTVAATAQVDSGVASTFGVFRRSQRADDGMTLTSAQRRNFDGDHGGNPVLSRNTGVGSKPDTVFAVPGVNAACVAVQYAGSDGETWTRCGTVKEARDGQVFTIGFCVDKANPDTMTVAGLVVDGVRSVQFTSAGQVIATAPVKDNAYEARLTTPADAMLIGDVQQSLGHNPGC